MKNKLKNWKLSLIVIGAVAIILALMRMYLFNQDPVIMMGGGLSLIGLGVYFVRPSKM